MKELVIDGLSIYEFLEGVMDKKKTLYILPLYIGLLDRAGKIYKWIINWWGCQPLIKVVSRGLVHSRARFRKLLMVPSASGDVYRYVDDREIK